LPATLLLSKRPSAALKALALVIATACTVFALSEVNAQSARSVESAYGPVEVKGTPKRVVTLSESALDTALAVRQKPVGTIAARGGDAVSIYLQDKAGKLPIVGTTREVNLESILAQQPDLILAANGLSKDVYAKLSMLAPTVVAPHNGLEDWRKNVKIYAVAMDRSDELEKELKAFDARVEAMRAKIPQGTTVSVARWNPQGPILMSSKVFAGQILSQLGLKMPELAGSLDQRPHSDVLSLENLSKIDADWVFLATLNAKGQETLDAARSQPAFTRLGAVKNGRAVTVDGQVWTSSTGVLAADQILNDIEKVLLP
jgi:iron complex transport system substrate-binding protein